MNILALDLAKQVGHARIIEGDPFASVPNKLISGSKSFAPLRGQTAAALFGKFSTWIDYEIRTHKLNVVSYERIDWAIKNKDWRAMYLGMTAIIRGACHNHNIDSKSYSVVDVKRAATGQAKADKGDMIRTARVMWPDQQIIDDNQADALWLLYVTMKDLQIPVKKHQEELF